MIVGGDVEKYNAQTKAVRGTFHTPKKPNKQPEIKLNKTNGIVEVINQVGSLGKIVIDAKYHVNGKKLMP